MLRGCAPGGRKTTLHLRLCRHISGKKMTARMGGGEGRRDKKLFIHQVVWKRAFWEKSMQRQRKEKGAKSRVNNISYVRLIEEEVAKPAA